MSNYKERKEVLLEGLSGHKLRVVDALLENQFKATKKLLETAGAGVVASGNFQRFDQIVGPLVRRVMPAVIAMELVGVQPLTGPTGAVRTVRARYSTTKTAGGPTAQDEASGTIVYDKYSLIASGDTAYTASDARTAAQITAALESDRGNLMNIETVMQTVTAQMRVLSAVWSIVADQDADNLDGLSMKDEMVAVLSDEIIRDIDREIITDLTNLAGTVKAFDFSQADGRFAGEKFSALSIGCSDLSRSIATKTKRGSATWMVVAPNVLTALTHASNGSFVPASPSGELMPNSTLFVGTFKGSVRVFLDIYASADTILMGYKGNDWDSGFVYAPYIPLMAGDVIQDPSTLDYVMPMMTRYAKASFTSTTTSLGNSADYYARAVVSNLALGF